MLGRCVKECYDSKAGMHYRHNQMYEIDPKHPCAIHFEFGKDAQPAPDVQSNGNGDDSQAVAGQLTNKQLKEKLTELGVAFPPVANKATLQSLLDTAQKDAQISP